MYMDERTMHVNNLKAGDLGNDCLLGRLKIQIPI
jgi:hypothetical protein